MTTHIYLVRHGKVSNPKSIFYGRMPHFGLEDPASLAGSAEFLRDKHIDAIYSSPLLRARQTATVLQKKTSVPRICIVYAITEVQTYVQGMSFQEIKKMNYDFYSRIPAGTKSETMQHIADRMIRFITAILTVYAGKSVVLVSHADPIMIVEAVINGLPLAFSSIRKPTRSFVENGEILEILAVKQEIQSIRSVFVPHESSASG